jgi:hypothetical protein
MMVMFAGSEPADRGGASGGGDVDAVAIAYSAEQDSVGAQYVLFRYARTGSKAVVAVEANFAAPSETAAWAAVPAATSAAAAGPVYYSPGTGTIVVFEVVPVSDGTIKTMVVRPITAFGLRLKFTCTGEDTDTVTTLGWVAR